MKVTGNSAWYFSLHKENGINSGPTKRRKYGKEISTQHTAREFKFQQQKKDSRKSGANNSQIKIWNEGKHKDELLKSSTNRDQ